MAIVSIGYDGTVDETQWAQMVSKVGASEYGVDKAGDFAVSIIAGDRAIAVSPGTAWGMGVMDTSDSSVNLLLDSVATGSRWDLIVLRRDWTPPGGTTVVAVVKGGSTKQIPGGRNSGTPGVLDDQPIALVRVLAGSTAVQEIVDLRVWGRNGGRLFAMNDLARSYITAVGTEINVNGQWWLRNVGVNNTAQWVKLGPVGNTDWSSISNSSSSGWKIEMSRYKTRNGVTQLQLTFERTGGTIESNASGDIGNVKVGTIGAGVRPSIWANLTTGTTGRMAAVTINSAGEVYITATTSAPISKGAKFQVSGTYLTD